MIETADIPSPSLINSSYRRENRDVGRAGPLPVEQNGGRSNSALAYDAAMGLGAAGFGVLAAQAGYPGAFALTGALMLVALVPAWVDRTA